jgi:hypothetical protein
MTLMTITITLPAAGSTAKADGELLGRLARTAILPGEAFTVPRLCHGDQVLLSMPHGMFTGRMVKYAGTQGQEHTTRLLVEGHADGLTIGMVEETACSIKPA